MRLRGGIIVSGRARSTCTNIAVLMTALLPLLLTPHLAQSSTRSSPAREAVPAPGRGSTAPTVGTIGRDISSEVSEKRGAARLFLFSLPEDAVQVDLSLHSDDGDVGLRAACAKTPPERDEDWSWAAQTEDGHAELSLARHAETDLRSGPFLVEVRPTSTTGHHGEQRALTFSLRIDVKHLQPPLTLVPGRGLNTATSPDLGHRSDFVFEVPHGADTLRIDLVEAERDLDLIASAHGSPLDADAAEWKAVSSLARESLVIDAGATAKLRAGAKIWFSVVDPSIYDAPVKFRVIVSVGGDPPAEALALPPLAQPTDPRERALAAVVEILVGDGSGSGTIVSADGLVLTARHVVGERAELDAEVVIGMNLDPTNITRELFRARVVQADQGLDVALLRITSGLYGQPLPAGYRFPACPLARDGLPRLGDELVTIGFPEPAGTGTRAPVMFSRGVVSGFERERTGLRIKTDAFVASGSSGGAALDAQYRLVGVPVFTMSDSNRTALLGFLVSVAELPREWRSMIEK